MPELVKKIVEFLEESKRKYPCETDTIYYANGKNGTRWDWFENLHLPTFGYGLANSDKFAFRCLVSRKGMATIYCYPNGEFEPVDTLEKQLFTQQEVAELYDIMYTATDAKCIYNAKLEDIWEEVK